MITIGKIQDSWGEGVYSMRDDCVGSNFLVRTVPPHKNYDPQTDMVECPNCHVKVALSVLKELAQRTGSSWKSNNTGEQEK